VLTAFGFPMWVCLAYLFILGTVVGSFLNVCIYRIPTQERFWDSLRAIVYPPSRCPRCRNRIPAWFNIPVFGWLMLRGRCFHCKGWISPRYPLIEFGNGVLWALVYWMYIPGGFGTELVESQSIGLYGPDAEGFWSPRAVLHWRYFYHMVLIEALVVASFIDFDLTIIPDGSTLPAMAVGVIGAVFLGNVYLTPVWHQDPIARNELWRLMPESLQFILIRGVVPDWIAASPHLHGLAVSLVGLVVTGGVVWLVRIMGHWAVGREAMGFGDVILMALIGSFLGWQAGVMVFFLAPAVALVVVIFTFLTRRQREIPFGPYLSIAALIVVLFWQQIWDATSQIFGSGPVLIITGLVMSVLFPITMRLFRIVLEALGFAKYDENYGEWTSADQLFHYSGENVDADAGQWKEPNWPGRDSSRGRTQYDTWRNGPPR